MFSVHTKTQASVFKFLRLEGRFRKLRFRGGLVWTVGLTVEIELRFRISSDFFGLVWTGPDATGHVLAHF